MPFNPSMNRAFGLVLSLLLLSSCTPGQLSNSMLTSEAKVADRTEPGERLKSLPAAKRKVVLSVYNFEDQTGQHKPSDGNPEYSRAVTQGGLAILNKALLDAGSHGWFTVIERGGLQNLLQERQIIRATRDQYRLPGGAKLPDLGPLLYAGLILEGGIVSYESNTLTGGVGARYLGIGGSTEYRQDIVTVYLRASSVQTGEVLISVNTSKTIFSAGVDGGAYKFVAFDKLLEIETGFSVNEPPQFAVRQAIEMAVYSLIMEGFSQGLWEFADPVAGQQLLNNYLEKRDGYVRQPQPIAAPAPQAAPSHLPSITQQEPPMRSLAREPVITPSQPQVNPTIEVPTGELSKTPNGSVQDPSISPEVQQQQQGITTVPLNNNPSQDKLYCTSGGCYPFPPPLR